MTRYGLNNFLGMIFLLGTLSLLACGSLVGSGSAGDGNASIDEIAPSNDIIDFDASTGSESYHSIGFTNSAGTPAELTSLVFYNNACGDFALYNITNSSGAVLLDNNDSVSLTIGAGQKVYVNIWYLPSDCVTTEYETTLYLYYTTEGEAQIASVILSVTGGLGPGRPNVVCEEYSKDFTYTAVTSINGAPPAGDYYLRVDRMRGYLYNTVAAAVVGTDINIEEGVYETPFIKVTVDDGGGVKLYKITDCDEFIIPSAEDDPNFWGASILLTTEDDIVGTVDESGNVVVSSLVTTIYAEDIDVVDSQVPNAAGQFQVSILSDLTTLETAEDEFLSQIFNVKTVDNPDEILPVSDDDDNDLYLMTGSPIERGTLSLVSRGTFTNEEEYIGSDSAGEVIFSGEAFMYFELLVTITTRDAGSGGEGESE